MTHRAPRAPGVIDLTSEQPCDEACAFAAPLRGPDVGDDWLWCMHPANDTKLVHRGAECRRYRPRESSPR